MVICDRPIVEVCPVEWARMTGATSKARSMHGTDPIRTVLQWDKDDCAAVGLVKFDLLGLGLLEVLHGAVEMVRDVQGIQVHLAIGRASWMRRVCACGKSSWVSGKLKK